MVMEGFNDRNETDVSLGGTVDGDSPQAFVENVTWLIDLIAEDWADAGFDTADLSFLTFGMYDIAEGNDELDEYRQALRDETSLRSDLSFIDLSAGQPDFAEGFGLGYYADGIHLPRSGALHYGGLIAQNLDAAVAGEITGDYDGNGFVSQADLDLVLLNWGESTLPEGWLAVDQFDGVAISQNELDGVLLNWGSGASVAAVPEPASGLCLLLFTAATCVRPERVRRQLLA